MKYNNNFTKTKEKTSWTTVARLNFRCKFKVGKLDLPISRVNCWKRLFFKPSFLYGCELWDFQNIDMLDFFRKLKLSTPNFIVY